MANKSQFAIKILKLYNMLRREPMTVERIMTDIECCRRSVYYYFRVFDEAGIFLTYEVSEETDNSTTKLWRILE